MMLTLLEFEKKGQLKGTVNPLINQLGDVSHVADDNKYYCYDFVCKPDLNSSCGNCTELYDHLHYYADDTRISDLWDKLKGSKG